MPHGTTRSSATASAPTASKRPKTTLPAKATAIAARLVSLTRSDCPTGAAFHTLDAPHSLSARRRASRWQSRLVDRQWSEDQGRELTELGVPSWAQVRSSSYDSGDPRLHAWVDDDGTMKSVLVGDPDGARLALLVARCDSLLSGSHERRPGTPPDDLEQPCAVAIVHRSGVGHGHMGREANRSLGELVSFARGEISRLLSQRRPQGD